MRVDLLHLRHQEVVGASHRLAMIDFVLRATGGRFHRDQEVIDELHQ